MIHKFLVRYVILIAALLLCAGAAWYLTNGSGDPHGDAVLACGGVPGKAAEALRQEGSCEETQLQRPGRLAIQAINTAAEFPDAGTMMRGRLTMERKEAVRL